MGNKFNIGDRVIVKRSDLDGKTGNIIGLDGASAAVQFDEFVGGHSCGGIIKGLEGKDGHCWWVLIRDLEPINTYKLIFKGNETILIKDGKEYISKCQKGDVFDKEKGLLLCLAKANGVSYADLQKMIDGAKYEPTEKQLEIVKGAVERIKVFAEAGFKALKELDNAMKKTEAENTVKEVKRPAKVGEYIKIVNAWGNAGVYKNGDVQKVIGTRGNGVLIERKQVPDGYYVSNNEYVVLENYKPYKITLSEFLKRNTKIAVNLKTRKEYDEFIAACQKKGKFMSFDGRNFSNKGDYCVGYNIVYEEGCCNKSFYEAAKCDIYTFNEVDLNN